MKQTVGWMPKQLRSYLTAFDMTVREEIFHQDGHLDFRRGLLISYRVNPYCSDTRGIFWVQETVVSLCLTNRMNFDTRSELKFILHA